MVSTSGKQTPMRPTEVRVVAAADATTAGWVARPVSHTFGAGRDGTELVSSLISEAERQGALAISDIAITLGAPAENGPTECRTSILPETISETHYTAPTHRMVPVQKPVSRMVTESQYRCHMESHPETRSVTEYTQRCQSVSRPVTRTRTTYSYQYDSFTHSSRSVPRTESYTSYESHQECHSEPQHRTRTENVMKNVCRSEPVSHMVTRYEFQYETQYVPPRLETLTHHRLREATPVCYALEAPAGAAEGEPAPAVAEKPANRIEAVFYFPRARAN
jgi:hypothetical protein